jgi:N-acetylglutamate synthase-like GNAT family acetyltransferase
MIRKFEIQDKESVLECLKEVWTIDKIEDSFLEEYLKNDNHLYVIISNNEIVGCATLHLQKKLIRNGSIAGFIEEVVIKEKYRNQNLGKKLINRLLEESIKLGCYKVTLSCFPERVNFYERCGFKNESITMRANLK